MAPQIPPEELRKIVEQADKELFQGWLDHPVTELLLTYLSRKKQDLMEDWADGRFAAPSLDEMAIRNAAAQGAVSILSDILNIDHVTLRGNNE